MTIKKCGVSTNGPGNYVPLYF